MLVQSKITVYYLDTVHNHNVEQNNNEVQISNTKQHNKQ